MTGRSRSLRRVYLFVLPILIVFFLSLLPSFTLAQKNPQQAKPKAILVTMDGVSLEDLATADMPYLSSLIRRGSLGLMNSASEVRSSRVSSKMSASGYLTIGTGVRADAGNYGGLAFTTTETWEGSPAGLTFSQRTGFSPPPQGVVHLAIADIITRCEKRERGAVPGVLGEALKEEGLTVAALGNADTDESHREVALIAMNEKGKIPRGDVSLRTVEPDPAYPYGRKTNYSLLLKESRRLLTQSDFLAVELGDFFRLNQASTFLTEEARAKHKQAGLMKADRFLEELFSGLDQNKTLLIIATPSPSAEAIEAEDNLTPLLVVGPTFEPGLLTSETTRQKGLVANFDLAPTVLKFLGASVPYGMAGRSLHSQAHSDPVGYLLSFHQRAVVTHQLRGPTLTTFVSLIVLTLIAGAILLIFGLKNRKPLKATQNVLLYLLCLPLAFLLTSLVKYDSFVTPIALSVAIGFVVAIGAGLGGKKYLSPIIWVSLATCGAIVLDTLTGAHLMARSILGYSPILGARFYGIGNEYMGVLLGASIILTGLWLDRLGASPWQLRAAGVLFLGLVILIALPSLGANVGGTIAAVGGCGVAYLVFSGKRIGGWQIAAIVGIVLLALLTILGVDFLSAGQSHVGRAAGLVKEGGAAEALKIIQRKLALNIRLIRYTVWTRLLLTVLIIFPLLLLRPVGMLTRIKKKHPHLMGSLWGIAIAAILAFVFNDSGVVAAATTMLFAIGALLFIIIEEQLTVIMSEP